MTDPLCIVCDDTGMMSVHGHPGHPTARSWPCECPRGVGQPKPPVNDIDRAMTRRKVLLALKDRF